MPDNFLSEFTDANLHQLAGNAVSATVALAAQVSLLATGVLGYPRLGHTKDADVASPQQALKRRPSATRSPSKRIASERAA